MDRLEIGAPGTGRAGKRRDHQNPFGAKIQEDIIRNHAGVGNGVDAAAELVGHQNLASKGAKAQGRYGWSFDMGSGVSDKSGSAAAIDLPHGTVLARHNHVVTKGAYMIESDPGVVLCATGDGGKERATAPGDFIDSGTLRDKDVARCKAGVCRLDGSDADVLLLAVAQSREGR